MPPVISRCFRVPPGQYVTSDFPALRRPDSAGDGRARLLGVETLVGMVVGR